MKDPAREAQILTLLRERDTLPVADLAAVLHVSEATVRRDLAELAARGKLRRLHGGATLTGLVHREPLFRDKEGLHAEAKRAIAHAALALIDDGDTIYLDGGSTLLHLARLLDRKHQLVIVTNSLSAAAALMDTEHRLILTGGEFRRLSRTLVGPLTAPLIQSLHVDKAFMGTIGFTLAGGMTTTDPNEAHTKELIMHRAGRVILLADSSKLGTASFARSGQIADIDTLVTDAIDPELQAALEREHIQVQLAPFPDTAN
jgi:DeoR family transcriptional regulator, fructose operon transcriptional repressor